MIPDAEQRVDTMIQNGRKIMAEVIEKFKPVAIVAAFSSGNDSIVSTHFAMEEAGDGQIGDYVFNADTMVGLNPSRNHLVQVCQRFKWALMVEKATPEGPPKTTIIGRRPNRKKVPFMESLLPAGKWKDGDTAYEEYCLNFGFPGRGMHHRMYQRLKERPINRMLKHHGAGAAKNKPKVLIVSGVRGDESAIRAGYQRAYAAGSYGDVWVNPFYYHTALDFEAYRQEFGLPRNPSKDKCGISGECCCGTFGDTSERESYQSVDPEFAAYLTDLERRVRENGFPWGWGENPTESHIAKERIVKDAKMGQVFMFDADERIKIFQPMCVGCNSGRR